MSPDEVTTTVSARDPTSSLTRTPTVSFGPQRDVRLTVGLETGQLDGEFIRGGEHPGEGEATAFVGDGRPDVRGGQVRHGDRGARNDSVACIFNGATQRGGDATRLREQGRGGDETSGAHHGREEAMVQPRVRHAA
jgi:hypothetical protein